MEKTFKWVKIYTTSTEKHQEMFGIGLGSVLCAYCGFATKNDPYNRAHDWACPYLWNFRELEHRGEGLETEVLLKDGIMPASESFF